MDIHFFIYNVLGGETLFYALHKEFKKSAKSFSTKYVVYEKINTHNNEIFHIRLANLQKAAE